MKQSCKSDWAFRVGFGPNFDKTFRLIRPKNMLEEIMNMAVLVSLFTTVKQRWTPQKFSAFPNRLELKLEHRNIFSN